MEEVMNGFFLG